ncbi:hypothetical protein CR513_20448 [Mucuna pruriens]|uniref:Uncharacterized protein n=1 Tax=Mucuna pruriens TaxID=157652 RepID=A0A371H241_MUCPR|nr:hypothetical protein CR513_20448 [Mucuna pruriens]
MIKEEVEESTLPPTTPEV